MSDERELTTADLAERDRSDAAEVDEQRDGRTDAERGEEDGLEPLLASEDSGRFRNDWTSLQARFVDEPRETVKEADSLVAELMQELARGFNETRASLEDQWNQGDDVSTEDLRVALKRYRSFFERLLAA